MIHELTPHGTVMIEATPAELAALNKVTAAGRMLVRTGMNVDIDTWSLETASSFAQLIFEFGDVEALEAFMFPHSEHGEDCPRDEYRALYSTLLARVREVRRLEAEGE